MARDFFHAPFRQTLQNEGWVITHDPYQLSVLGVDYDIDLGAEKLLAAERGAQKIAVEVKSFLGFSFSYEFHQAIGQFIDYSILLRTTEPERILFLAVTQSTWDKKMSGAAFQLILKEAHIRVIVFDPDSKKITTWIE